jgi:hypothetical protein
LQHTPSAQFPDLQSKFILQAEPLATNLAHFNIGLQSTSHPLTEAIPLHDDAPLNVVQLFWLLPIQHLSKPDG